MDGPAAYEIALADLRRRFDREDVRGGSDVRCYIDEHNVRREGSSWVVAGFADRCTFVYNGKKPWYVRRSKWSRVVTLPDPFIFKYVISEDGRIMEYDLGFTQRGR
jgi:hypothetical protein